MSITRNSEWHCSRNSRWSTRLTFIRILQVTCDPTKLGDILRIPSSRFSRSGFSRYENPSDVIGNPNESSGEIFNNFFTWYQISLKGVLYIWNPKINSAISAIKWHKMEKFWCEKRAKSLGHDLRSCFESNNGQIDIKIHGTWEKINASFYPCKSNIHLNYTFQPPAKLSGPHKMFSRHIKIENWFPYHDRNLCVKLEGSSWYEYYLLNDVAWKWIIITRCQHNSLVKKVFEWLCTNYSR